MTEQERDTIKQQIAYETEVFRATLLVAVAAVGGTVGLVLGEPSPWRAVLAGTGIIASLGTIAGVVRQDRVIRRLLERLEEEHP